MNKIRQEVLKEQMKIYKDKVEEVKQEGFTGFFAETNWKQLKNTIRECIQRTTERTLAKVGEVLCKKCKKELGI